ncbi:MAG TPA: Gfo/Idh/MocA family oxidoreductase [Pseudonocardia sp.]|jgi:predicted dehydrogenase|nr:Gfo/Idh/MocA family oxidoreductase [Pseudonocardia sp.]
MRLGLVGYGVGGRYFHAPFIAAATGVELAGVVTRSPDRRAELTADFPGVPAYDSLTELLSAGVDAVTITTPPKTRRALVLEAIAAGVPTIADKPFAPTADGGRELVAAARAAGVPLNVFHNRRWDADIRTLAAVLEDGRLGEVWGVESRMDQDGADTLEVGPDGGLLRDLGSHLVDQVLWLLGPAAGVYAELDHVELADGRTDCRFDVSITHRTGVRSRVTASKINHIEDRELRAYGSGGSYVARSTDVQAQAIFAGRRPVDEGERWGYDDPERWGILRTADGATTVPSEQGAYQDYYTRFAAAVAGEGEFPVPAEQAVHTLEVLDAARTSAERNEVVHLSG